jgi:hypothetical protein
MQQEGLWLILNVIDLSRAYTQILEKKVISLLLIHILFNSSQVNEDCVFGEGRDMVEDRQH